MGRPIIGGKRRCAKCRKIFIPFIVEYRSSPNRPEHFSHICESCRKDKSIVTTGSLGLIGSRIRDKYKTNGVDWLTRSNIHRYDPKLIIHCGAMTKINESISNPQKYFSANVLGTFEILESCRNHNADIIYFSSSRVESAHKNPYVASKIYGEELCKAYHECYGIKYKIIRPSTVYGPGDKNRLVSIFIQNAIEGKPLTIYGNEDKSLNFTYIEDFLQAFDLIYKKGAWNTDYDVGGETRKVFDAAMIIKMGLHSESIIEFKDAEVAQPQQVNIDDSKVRALGYVPRYSLEEGLIETWTSALSATQPKT
jgi:nucleoside-diphosphate-sugar epimerase